MLCSANRRSLIFRTCEWSTRNLFYTETMLTSKLSQQRSGTPTEQHCELSCDNGWDEVCAICVLTCADTGGAG